MTLKEQKNGVMISEDVFSYPDPELVIRSVTRLEDVRYLTSLRGSAGMVYCYGDRDWRHGLVNYTGETKNAVATRHATTHSKSAWLPRITYPLIIAVQPVGKDWDTDTRRAIESMLVYKKNLLGFDVANAENSTWRENMSTRPMEDIRYARDVVRKVIEYELHHLGMLGLDIAHYKDTGEVITSLVPSYSQQILNSEMAIKKIVATSTKTDTVVKGWELESGKVVVTEVINLPPEPSESASDLGKLPLRHAQLLAEAKQEPNGSFTWQGQTPPDRPGVWLSAAMGKLMQKSAWLPDLDLKRFQLLEILPSDATIHVSDETIPALVAEIEVMVKAQYKNTVVFGMLSQDGSVVLTEVHNLPPSLPQYMKENEEVCQKHQTLLDEAVQADTGLTWKGHTEQGDRLDWLYAAVGSETADLWEQVPIEPGQPDEE